MDIKDWLACKKVLSVVNGQAYELDCEDILTQGQSSGCHDVRVVDAVA